MGFPRLTPAADVAFPYICSQDTAVLRDVFDDDAAIASLDVDAAIARYVDDVCGKDATAEQRADALRLATEDQGTRDAAIAAEKIRLILDAFYRQRPDCKVERARFEALADLDAVIGSVRSTVRKLAHRAYRESGDENELGPIGDDVIRWRLRMLQPRERAEAKGRISEQPAGVPQYVHFYNVNRWIVSLVLIGADGWPEFATDKKTGLASQATIDAIDEDWIIELGDFCLEVPSLRKAEKKA